MGLPEWCQTHTFLEFLEMLEEPVQRAIDEPDFPDVEMSSGCAFCDVGLKPEKMKRRWVHYIRKEGRLILCERMTLKSALE
jgi:hypothetical protein